MPTASYKCPNCGGSLLFKPDIQKNKCEYCLSEFTDEELEQISQSLEAKAATAGASTPPPETVTAVAADGYAASAAADGYAASAAADGHSAPVGTEPAKGYTCDNCGAEVVTDATTSATYCYYCHSPVLLTDRLTGAFRPSRIIPFAFDKQKAVDQFLHWAKTKRFVPKSFYSDSQLEKITGLYVPCWMADTQAAIDYVGKGITRRTWISGYTEYTETKEYQIARQGTIDLAHIHEIANRKIDRRLIDSITPFDESAAVDFSMSYLSGFLAEKYDIPKEEVEPRITDRARSYVLSMIQETLAPYQQLQMERQGLDLSVKGWDYALFPAWILTYEYRGKTYVYAMNGQNGKSFGELPVDNGKLGITSGLIAAALCALALIGGMLIW
jgi:DNA-directed RNA polymerase subunit RPC12/RpoP